MTDRYFEGYERGRKDALGAVLAWLVMMNIVEWYRAAQIIFGL